jgi:hypothetical protein
MINPIIIRDGISHARSLKKTSDRTNPAVEKRKR